MVNILKKNKELLILIGIVLALALCLELPSWLQGGYFVGGGDIKTQWYPFYVLNRRETINAIKSGSFPFYSWVLFLGNNIWASKTSYGFVDIFNLIFYVFRWNYFLIYDIQIILKLLTAGITFYLFISYAFNNKKAGLFGGILYASSSYLLYFTSQSSFISVVALAPLYLLGIEKYIKENKCCLFIISVTLLLLTNYYIFFSLTIISPFYFLYRYYNINNNFKGIIKSVIKIIFYYLVGLMISAIFILPAFFYVLQNERVGYMNSKPFSYSDIKVYLNVLFSMFVPSDLFIYGNNVFNFDSHELKELCIFTSSFVSVLIPQVFISKDKEFKHSTILFYIVCALFLFIPYLSSVMNGFSSVCFRWTYILLIFNILVAMQILFVNKELSPKVLLISFAVISVLILVLYFSGLILINEPFTKYTNQFYICLICIGFLALYCFCFLKNKKLLVYLLVFEILIHGVVAGVKNKEDSVTKAELDKVTSVLFDPNTEVINEYLSDLDPDNKGKFYRIYVPCDSLYWDFSRNMNLIYGFNGTMTYDSTYEPSFADMINIKNEGIVQTIYWDFDITDPELLNFLSCKYAFTVNEDEIPFNNYQILDGNYLNGIIISKNLDYHTIGETYSIRETNANRDFSKLNTSIISEDSNIDKYLISKNVSKLENIEYTNNKITGTINSDDISFVVLKISYDDGFKIKVNDNYVDKYKCNGGMIGFPIEKGNNNVSIEFTPKGFNEGCTISLVGLLIFIILLFKNKIIYLINKQHI